MKAIPFGHRVLIRKAEIDERDPAFKAAKAAGIVLAKDHEDARRREAGVDRGWVVAIGPEAFKGFYLNSHGTLDGFTPWARVGDFVAFAKSGGMVVSKPGSDVTLIVMNDEDLVCLLEESENE